jgi:signal transduction histidine kinase
MPRTLPGARGRVRGVQLLVLLLIASVVPSASVLWFMNEAVVSQVTVARTTLADAYRGQLRLMRGRLQTYWQTRLADLETRIADDPSAAFHDLVTRRAADTVIVLQQGIRPQYPSLTTAGGGAPAGASTNARALQLAIRDVVQQGRSAEAVDLIGRHFLAGPASRGVDADGRLIAADEQLLLVNLLPASDPRRPQAIGRLTALLNDYAAVRLPSAQRVFLMEQLRTITGEGADARFPTLGAERLALSFLEGERPARGEVAFRPTATPDLWQVPSPGGRVVALYSSDSLRAAARSVLDDHSAGIAFRIIPPGAAADDEAISVGAPLPGWDISFTTVDAPADGLAPARRATYVAIALVAIGAGAIAIALAGGAARRQARLAALRSDLVSAVSHELKTPLASMRLLVDALLDDERLDEVKTREYLQLMSVENARLTRLIENFLTFSRLERKRQQFNFSPIDPAELARAAVSAMPERRPGEAPPTLEIAADVATITADRDALMTVLLNLLDNAYKYTPGDHRISLRVAREAEAIAFAVHDNGIGIAPRDVKRIFRRFYRVDEKLAGATAGSGLGLSIVDAIVRAHGGHVDVSSAPGQGSIFTVRLPSASRGAAV